jgi:hypothetical protein
MQAAPIFFFTTKKDCCSFATNLRTIETMLRVRHVFEVGSVAGFKFRI